MSDGKQTKGPWEELTPSDNIWPPRVFAGSEIIAMVDNSDMTQDEKIANARLIAAAPDMLEALLGMVRLAELDGVDDRIICHESRAAIAKATGETQ